MVGLALQIVIFRPLLKACQRSNTVGVFRIVLGEDKANVLTEALTSTVRVFSVFCWGCILTLVNYSINTARIWLCLLMEYFTSRASVHSFVAPIQMEA